MSDIILSEEFVKRLERLAVLRNRLAGLFERREHMVTFESNTLVALYTERVGKLQYEEFTLKVEVMRLKRKAQLMQVYINRGEKIEQQKIEQRLEKEFAEYQRQIDEQTKAIQAANDYLRSPLLSEEENQELKHLYHILVKRLHPDWNPKLSQEMKDMFVRAQAAYKMCNLQELRNILLMLNAEEPKQEVHEDEITHLEEAICKLEERIKQLNESFPFNLREKIEDEIWVEEQQKEIRERIAKLIEEKKVWELFVGTLTNKNEA